MTNSRLLLSRRAIVHIGGLTAAGALAFSPSAIGASGDVAPIDRGQIDNATVKFSPIAATSEAGEEAGEAPLPRKTASVSPSSHWVGCRSNKSCRPSRSRKNAR